MTTASNDVDFQLGKVQTLMSIIFLPNTDDDNSFESFNDCHLVQRIMDEIQDVDHDKTDDVNLSPAKALMSVPEQLTALRAWMKVVAFQEIIDLLLFHCLCVLLQPLNHHSVS